jgi:tetratricopeptide (TPR) repeat protein
LSCILEQYAKALPPAERDLLARLSLFPRGVKVEFLAWIAQSGGEVAGALIGLADHQLMKHLEWLKGLGLVFRYEIDQQAVYSAHPFLREFFRNLLRTKPESVHESVRAKLTPSLEARPKTKPTDPAILDQYEMLIEQTLLAGRVREAFDLFWRGLGGHEYLGRVLGENSRGRRILEHFAPQDDLSRVEPELSRRDLFALVNNLGLFTRNLGDLARAREAFAHCQRLLVGASDQNNKSRTATNLALIELQAGHFPKALEYSQVAVSLATRANTVLYIKILQAQDEAIAMSSVACQAKSHFALGDITSAMAEFRSATETEGSELKGEPLYILIECCIDEAERKLLRGDGSGARSQTRANREIAVRNNFKDTLCGCNTLLARLLLPDDPAGAIQLLQDARAFANRSGDVELQLECFHAACAVHLHLGDYPHAIIEGESGILLADTYGFGKYSIDLRLVLAETFLAASTATDDARKALQSARNALDRSEQPDCEYAWGQADGLHFCGIAHLRLGERELARQRLTAALELRERLGHGRVEETRRALALCRA